MEDYFNEVFEKLDNISDNDFDKLLIESGIENCPLDIKNKIDRDNKLIEQLSNDIFKGIQVLECYL